MRKSLFLLFFLASGFVCVLMFGNSVSAATIAVNTATDEFGSSPSTCSVREAIEAAKIDTAYDGCMAGLGADTIEIPSGIYALDSSLLVNDAVSSDSITINGNPAGDTLITGSATLGGGAGDNLLTINQPNSGGGQYIELNNLHFTNQYGTSQQAVVATNSQGNEVILNNTTISGMNMRGFVHLHDPASPLGSGVARINNSFIELNQGGGVLNQACSFAANIESLYVTNSQISNNSVVGDGGGIQSLCGLVTLDNVTISNNIATSNGGGIFISASPDRSPFGSVESGEGGSGLSFTNVTIANNQASVGGGIFNQNYEFPGLDSNADGDFDDTGDETPYTNLSGGFIFYTTIANNTATNPGAAQNLYNGDDFAGGLGISASIIAGTNAEPNCSFSPGTTLGDYYSLSTDGSCTGFSQQNAIAALAPLANNGGIAPIGSGGLQGNVLTMTFDTSTSGAFNIIPDDGGRVCGSVDQRNLSRPQGGSCDIGAVEMPFVIVLPIYDLALNIQLKPGQPPFVKGGPIIYTITVTNQGNQTVHSYDIKDRIPNGLVLNDSAWVLSDSTTASKTIATPIAPTESQSYDITFTVSPDATTINANSAEISAMRDENGMVLSDTDSVPDDNTLGQDDMAQINFVLSEATLVNTGIRTLILVSAVGFSIIAVVILVSHSNRKKFTTRY
jgi:CSLREA domain-containing protein/uncharacterized repeat protein (TIGR01451 family)